MGEETPPVEGAAKGSRVPLAVLLTSLFWVTVCGLALFLWRKPAPVAFEIQPPPATVTPLPTATPEPTATPPPLLVHVDGAVETPGVVQLAPGSRLQDAIAAAGGLAKEADLASLSLAVALRDGQKVYVPVAGETPPPQPIVEMQTGENPAEETPVEMPININRASEAELQALPGIGPKTAAAILAYRDQNGPFAAVDNIVEVKGIGESTLAKLRQFITVGP
ncbi:MAG: helix-hairpin-helix domain-containing protein [Chloroflexota bacterium]|nr:helix-hairpin-helix domain-containing protein [Chloroflexota bacterium]